MCLGHVKYYFLYVLGYVLGLHTYVLCEVLLTVCEVERRTCLQTCARCHLRLPTAICFENQVHFYVCHFDHVNTIVYHSDTQFSGNLTDVSAKTKSLVTKHASTLM